MSDRILKAVPRKTRIILLFHHNTSHQSQPWRKSSYLIRSLQDQILTRHHQSCLPRNKYSKFSLQLLVCQIRFSSNKRQRLRKLPNNSSLFFPLRRRLSSSHPNNLHQKLLVHHPRLIKVGSKQKDNHSRLIRSRFLSRQCLRKRLNNKFSRSLGNKHHLCSVEQRLPKAIPRSREKQNP